MTDLSPVQGDCGDAQRGDEDRRRLQQRGHRARRRVIAELKLKNYIYQEKYFYKKTFFQKKYFEKIEI